MISTFSDDFLYGTYLCSFSVLFYFHFEFIWITQKRIFSLYNIPLFYFWKYFCHELTCLPFFEIKTILNSFILVMIQCFQVFFEFPESCFIMSSVDQKILRQILHTTMMIYMYQRFLDYFITDSYIPSYLIGDACIFYLMFSEKIRCYFSFLGSMILEFFSRAIASRVSFFPYKITGIFVLMIPHFSAAIFSRLSQRNSIWSYPMLVITERMGFMILVASSLHHIPTSMTLYSHHWSRK